MMAEDECSTPEVEGGDAADGGERVEHHVVDVVASLLSSYGMPETDAGYAAGRRC